MAAKLCKTDKEYEQWLFDNHDSGYMANTYRPPSKSYFRIHRAACTNMPDRSKPGNVNPKTARRYSKVIAESIAELRDWARENLNLEINGSNYCESCTPRG